jgi:transcriptional regulator GlxA family with amidase domain
MKLISIILPEEGVAASVTDTIRFFAKANDLLKRRENEEWFKVQTVCFTREIAWNQGQLRVKADALLHESGNSHLVIVPAIDGDVIKATQLNRHYIPWLIKQYENGAGIAAFCMGNFLLAAAGLLNGRTGQTHWIYAKEFTAYYPRIKLAGENVITGGNGIYTIGGGVTYWNLLLYLLEKFTDRELTMNVAHYFSLNADSLTQSEFMLFHSQKQHGDELIQRVQHYIEQNVHEKTNIEKVKGRETILHQQAYS